MMVSTGPGVWKEGRRLQQAVFKTFVPGPPGPSAAALAANCSVTVPGAVCIPSTCTGRQSSAFFSAKQEGYASPTLPQLVLFVTFIVGICGIWRIWVLLGSHGQ